MLMTENTSRFRKKFPDCFLLILSVVVCCFSGIIRASVPEKPLNMLGYCNAPYILEGVKSGRLSKRIGLYRTEIDWSKIPQTYGAKPIFNGSVIGGGKGYSDIVTSGDYVAKSYDELKSALAKAKPDQTVFIPGSVKIDFLNKKTLTIPAHVTLASDRGHNGSAGALLYISRKKGIYMLRSGGDFIRVSGLRIQGPWDAIKPVSFNGNGISLRHFGAEVDNCEISAFPWAGISADGCRSYVHNNYFHHNCRTGLGYGVAVSRGTPIIEGNKFFYNRHHVAATGKPLMGYEIRYNVATGYGNFDMHGYYNSGQSVANLIGGNFWDIHHNTMDTSGMGIRGIPSAFLHISCNRLLFKQLTSLFHCRGPQGIIAGNWHFPFGTPWAQNWSNLTLGPHVFGSDSKVYSAEALSALARKQYAAVWRAKMTGGGEKQSRVYLAKFNYLLAHPELLYHENCGKEVMFPPGLKCENNNSTNSAQLAVEASEKLAVELEKKMQLEENAK